MLNGAKQFVDAARSATDFLVTAMTVEGNVLLSVPARTRGLSIAERPGIDGAAIATVSFVECFIPSERLLASGEQHGAILDAALLRARLALAAELAGLASGALERTVAYTRDRVQFGKPIASFQSIQHRLVEMWMDAEFACAAVGNAVGTLATRRRSAAPVSRCWRRRRGQAMPPSPSAGAPCTFMARWALPTSAISGSISSAPSASTLRSASPSSFACNSSNLERAA